MTTSFSQACTQAGQLPSGALIKQCQADPCKAAWSSIDADVKEVLHLKSGSPLELLERNKKISSAYAKLFLSQAPDGTSTKIPFIGAASFGSKQVGCAMTSAFGAAVGLGAIPGRGGGLGDVSALMFKRLADGNAAIFESFYPASRFYAENVGTHGKDWVFNCLEKKYPPDPLTGRPAPVVEGLRKMSEGQAKDGVMAIVRHEQGPILEQSMYHPPNSFPGADLAFETSMNASIGLGQFNAVYAAGCSASSAAYVVRYPGWTISYANRMQFFELAVDKFTNLWSTQQNYMIGELRTISRLYP